MATPPDFTAGSVLTAAQMNAVGLWRITGCTVTSVGGTAATASNGVITIGSGNTSVTVSSAFSGDFTNYRIIMEGIVNSTAANLELQLSGITTNVYSTGGTFFTYGSATVSGYGPAAGARWLISPAGATNTHVIVDVLTPQSTTQKAMFTQGTSTASYYSFGGTCTSTSSATGFVVSSNAGSMTGGTIRVYGYRK